VSAKHIFCINQFFCINQSINQSINQASNQAINPCKYLTCIQKQISH